MRSDDRLGRARAGSPPPWPRARAPGAASRSSPRVCEAITARRSREVPVGHGRRADRLGEHARARAPPRTSASPGAASPTTSGTICVSRAGDLEALAGELVAQRVGVGLELARRGAAARRSSSSAASAPATAGGGSAVEKISERAVLTRYCAISASQAHVGAVGAERLAERADDDVDLVLEPGLGDGAAAAGAERAGAVRLVDDHAHVVAPGELDDLRQRRDVAVHREDAVGDDQRAAPLGLAQAPREVVDVAVVVDEGLGPRQPAAVDDRGVVELVGEDDLAARRASAETTPSVRQVAGAEQQRRLGALERRPAAPRGGGGSHRCSRHEPRRARRRRPSASPRRRPPRARAGGRRGRGSCSSTAAARACRRARTRGPCGPLTMRMRR